MLNYLRKISLGNWILIAMILGVLTGLFLNFHVENHFIKNFILMDNVFYLGGDLFIRLMKMLVVPLVFCSIIMSIASVSDIRKLGTIGARSILFFMFTNIFSIFIALVLGAIIKPGAGLTIPTSQIMSNSTTSVTLTDTILNIFPENPFNALTNGEMLPIILFGILIGFILIKLKDETSTVYSLFDELNHIVMKMTNLIMKIAPIGVFCMMARTFGTLGFESILPLAKFIGCIILVIAIQIFVFYPIIFIIFTRANPLKFYRKFLPAMFFAFSSSSSNAPIPLSMENLDEMGVSHDVSLFTIPLGSSLNKSGSAVFFSVGVLFAAQAYGIDFNTTALLTAVITILMATISSPTVPMASVFTLSMIFNIIGLPIAVIDLITGIYAIIGMFNALSNLTGNGICTSIVAYQYKSFDMDTFNEKKKPEKT
ncbi:dicarboxylate/amino acid:cation symporter [Methanobrevibacter sp.]|uniref:dicarboxylate/amino acid:cation symporter n=1 Tax=Methanobrevibacter sp. TaxID=66852 RepID=UPI00386C0BCE